MNYQALYRTWRPQKFTDMVGQEVVTKILINSLITEQISHAYLFTGPRGTGKTSAAKIFAKTINCLNVVDGEADNTCEICKLINKGTLGDIIELDAASHNGVDDIREIREDVNYVPTLAKYKVYIIDEVHMLSTGAFNALLKTLEEPPTNVIFILATTEPQKIPVTIISRTQRFDFKQIDVNSLYERMIYILEQRKNIYDQTAIKIIANSAEGSMRDALSILDQVLSFGNGRVTLENTLLVTGSVNKTLLGEYIMFLVKHNSKSALEKLEDVLNTGKDAGRFVEDLISYIRDLLLSVEAPDLISLVPDDNFKQLSNKKLDNLWYKMIDVLSETQQQLRFVNRPSIYLEVLTIKLSRLDYNDDKIRAVDVKNSVAVETKTSELLNNEENMEDCKKTSTVVLNEISVSNDLVNMNNESEQYQQVFTVLDNATRKELNCLQEIWLDIVSQLSVSQKAILSTAKPVAASSKDILLCFDFEIFRNKIKQDSLLISTLNEQIKKLTKNANERNLVLVTKEEWSNLRQQWIDKHRNTKNNDSENEIVTSKVELSTNDVNQTKNEKIVEVAKNIFGDNLVEVKSD